MRSIYILIAIFFSLIYSSCSNHTNTSSLEGTECSHTKCNVEDLIKDFFDNKEYKYHLYTDEDSTITFELGFKAQNENISVHIIIIPNSLYQIVGNTETSLPSEYINNGIIAINNYNMDASVVTGCISPEGNIIFWLGRNIDGNTFSEEAFAIDLAMVMKEADYKTAQIYKQACIQDR